MSASCRKVWKVPSSVNVGIFNTHTFGMGIFILIEFILEMDKHILIA